MTALPLTHYTNLLIMKRKQQKIEGILKLRAVFPYGFKDRAGNEYIKEDCTVLVGTKFSSFLETIVELLLESPK